MAPARGHAEGCAHSIELETSLGLLVRSRLCKHRSDPGTLLEANACAAHGFRWMQPADRDDELEPLEVQRWLQAARAVLNVAALELHRAGRDAMRRGR